MGAASDPFLRIHGTLGSTNILDIDDHFKVMNCPDTTAIEDLCAEDLIDHDKATADRPPGLDGVKAPFPDMHDEIVAQIAEGGGIFNVVRVTGTHLGDDKGLPATGNKISINAMYEQRFDMLPAPRAA